MLSVLKRLTRHNKSPKTTIWGVRVPENTKIRWRMLATVMRVPVNRLVTYVLRDWIQKNADTLLSDESRNKLADRITQAYLNNKLN